MNGKPRVVYTDPWFAVRDGRFEPALATLEREVYGDDVAVDFGPFDGQTFAENGDALYERLRGANAVVVLRTQITERIVEAAGPACRVIGRFGVGFDNLNVPLLARAGIYGFNIPDYCTDEVSTHALALALALERNVVLQDREIRAGRWDKYAGPSPVRTNRDGVFGIVGLGRIGRSAARKAAPFYRRVVAYDPYVQRDIMEGLGVEKIDSLERFMGVATAISLHVPLDDSTRNIIDAAVLAAALPGARLINTARGGLVDPVAVRDALASGRLGGYASDVFEPEDPNAHPVNREILEFPNVVVTAHSAFRSAEAERSQRVRCAQEIRAVLVDGVPPRFGRLA